MSVTRITTRKHGGIPSQDSHRGPHGCPGTVQSWPCYSLAAARKSWPHLSLGVALGRAGPVPLLGSIVELALGVGMSRSQVMSVEELTLPLSVLIPHPSPPPAVGEAVHRVMGAGELSLPLSSCSTSAEDWDLHLVETTETTLMVGAQVGQP